MEIRKLCTRSEVLQGYDVLKELRKDLTLDRFEEIYDKAVNMDRYELTGAFDQRRLVAVMGHRFQYDFVRGKHLYIDDLITTQTLRSRGIGAKLLAYAEEFARKAGCSVMRLCAHVENIEGQKFYDREDWYRRAIAYQKSVS